MGNPNASENVSNMMATDDDDEARKQAVGDDAALGRNAKAVQQAESEDGDADDDVCGICRIPFDGCCPECKVPGDACPLIWGECTHVFHMHCLLKWLSTESSKQQCPMDRRPWVTQASTKKEET